MRVDGRGVCCVGLGLMPLLHGCNIYLSIERAMMETS